MIELTNAIRDLDEKKVYELIDEKIDAGVDPVEILKACNTGIVAVGDLFSSGKYFISELIYSAEIFKNVMKKLEPTFQGASVEVSEEKVVIGTVKGDIHDIGKNIVVNFLRGAGFDVIDLGVDVPTEKFVETVKETGAKVVGLSALLNLTYPEMKNVVDAFNEAGIRDKVTIIIGGAPVNEQVREFSGADFYAEDAMEGVEICKKVYA